MPSALWSQTRKEFVQQILDLITSVPTDDENDVRKLNMRLKTFDALLKSRFAPRLFLRSRLKDQTNRGPARLTEFRKALLAMVDGKCLVELTEMASQGSTFDNSSEFSVSSLRMNMLDY